MSENQNQHKFVWNDEFAILISRYLDSNMSADEMRHFYATLGVDSDAREQFVSMAIVDQELHEQSSSLESEQLRSEVERVARSMDQSSRKGSTVIPPIHSSNQSWTWPTWPVVGWVTAAILMGTISVVSWIGANSRGLVDQGNSGNEVNVGRQAIASILRTTGSDVGEHIDLSNPSLDAGEVLTFSKGVVEIGFGDAAILTLTGPARIRIDSRSAATLFFGRLAAKVNETGIGFKLSTPDANVVDLGTEFAVVVPSEGKTIVKVISGLVDVTSVGEDDTTRLSTGESRQIANGNQLELLEEIKNPFGGFVYSLDAPDQSIKSSKDCFIIGGDWVDTNMHGAGDLDDDHMISGTDILVKRDYVMSGYNRRGLIGFDLSKIDRKRIIGARLVLTLNLNDLTKNASFHQVVNREKFWRFSVGGVWDHGQAEWQENTVTWNNAPGHDPNSISGELEGVNALAYIGDFNVVGAGKKGQQVVVDSAGLVDFLRQERDGKVTFLLNRLNGDVASDKSYDHTVHGFAGRENLELQPPTLELWYGNDSQRFRTDNE